MNRTTTLNRPWSFNLNPRKIFLIFLAAIVVMLLFRALISRDLEIKGPKTLTTEELISMEWDNPNGHGSLKFVSFEVIKSEKCGINANFKWAPKPEGLELKLPISFNKGDLPCGRKEFMKEFIKALGERLGINLGPFGPAIEAALIALEVFQ